jgi:hypothetical protein
MKEGGSWQLVGRVMSKPASIGVLQYELFDLYPLNGWSYYRLKIIERDGSISFSNPQAIYFGEEVHINVYPNPATSQVVIALPRLINPKLKVFNALGAQIELTYNNMGNKVVLNTNALCNGIYFFELLSGNKNYSGSFTIHNQD